MTCARCGGAIFPPNTNISYSGQLCNCQLHQPLPANYNQLQQQLLHNQLHQNQHTLEQGSNQPVFAANQLHQNQHTLEQGSNQPLPAPPEVTKEPVPEKTDLKGTIGGRSQKGLSHRQRREVNPRTEQRREYMREYHIKAKKMNALMTEDITVVRKRLIKTLCRETNWLMTTCMDRKLTADESSALTHYIKLTTMLINTEEKEAQELSDSDLEKMAEKKEVNAESDDSEEDT